MKNNKTIYALTAAAIGVAAMVTGWYFLIYKKKDETTAPTPGAGAAPTPASPIPSIPHPVMNDVTKFQGGDKLYATTATPLYKSKQLGNSNVAMTINPDDALGTFVAFDGTWTRITRTEGNWLIGTTVNDYYIYKSAQIHTK